MSDTWDVEYSEDGKSRRLVRPAAYTPWVPADLENGSTIKGWILAHLWGAGGQMPMDMLVFAAARSARVDMDEPRAEVWSLVGDGRLTYNASAVVSLVTENQP